MEKQNYILSDEFDVFKSRIRKEKQAILEESGEERVTVSDPNDSLDSGKSFEEQRISLHKEMIASISNILDNAIIIDVKKLKKVSNDNARIGKSVTVVFSNGEEKVFKIGGHNTPIEGRISYDSPLGRAVIGKSEGDNFSYDVFSKEEGTSTYEGEILKIETYL